MMDAIKEKLRRVFAAVLDTEMQVVYVLVEIRKYLEQNAELRKRHLKQSSDDWNHMKLPTHFRRPRRELIPYIKLKPNHAPMPLVGDGSHLPIVSVTWVREATAPRQGWQFAHGWTRESSVRFVSTIRISRSCSRSPVFLRPARAASD